jgi:hypothetical protein
VAISLSLQVAKQLLEEVQKEASEEWSEFQAKVTRLKLKRSATASKIAESEALLSEFAAAEELSASESEWGQSGDQGGDSSRATALAAMGTTPVNIVMITGIESFNQRLYRTVAKQVPSRQTSVPQHFVMFCRLFT